jgi:hypothetical protein
MSQLYVVDILAHCGGSNLSKIGTFEIKTHREALDGAFLGYIFIGKILISFSDRNIGEDRNEIFKASNKSFSKELFL